MKVLIVCSGNLGRINPFISDQASALNAVGVSTEYFLVKGKGFFGYLKNLPVLKKQVRSRDYDLVHAHYGLSGMLAVLQRSVPVIITFHGTDVNSRKNFLISLIASKLSSYNILTSDSFIEKLNLRRDFSVIPCGINLDVFKVVKKTDARKQMNLTLDRKIILFSSRFDNKVKNYPLAKKVSEDLKREIPSVKLLELRNYSRDQMNLLLNAADVLLVTSFSESGPLVVKEALACNLPVVSTDVGDVQELLQGTTGSYITSYEPFDVVNKLRTVIMSGRRIDTRGKVSGFENTKVAMKIRKVYEAVSFGLMQPA